MSDLATPRRSAWALPPQPPESWVGSVWAGLLLVSVGVAVAVPLESIRTAAAGAGPFLALCRVLACAAAAVVAFALPVQAMVNGDRRLPWLAGGFAAAYLLLLQPVALSGRPVEQLAALALAAVALAALTAADPRPDRLLWLLLPAAGAAVVGVATLLLPARALWAASAVLALTAALRWVHSDGWAHRHWIAAGLLVGGLAGLLRAAADSGGNLWWAGVVALMASLVLPASGIGYATLTGFGRQSRSWRRLEAEVRALRRGSRLLPNRAITPEDDEGLPGADEIRAVLTTANVRMVLQPVLHLDSGVVVGSEALARFAGGVPTERWFKAASRHGLAVELERLTLGAALTLLPGMPDGQFLAVNISPVALAHDAVLTLLHDTDLSRVVVEITEHDAVADYALTREVLSGLRARGARIAVDDTGAGFATLRHILLLQPDIIKLDISLTRHVDVDRRQQALVRAVAVFSAQVGATVLAEGVETRAQLAALREIGVDLGQGWHLGVPVL